MEPNKSYRLLVVLLCILAVVITGMFAAWIIRGGVRLAKTVTQETKPYEICTDETYDVSLTKVKLQTNYANVIVENSPDSRTHLQIKAEKKDVRIAQQGNALSVNVKIKTKTGIGFNAVKMEGAEIRLALPADFSGELAYKSEYGDIRCAAFPQASFEIDADYGSVSVESAASLKADCDYGSITVGEISTALEIKAACGSIHIDKLALRENGKMECNLGSIFIGSADNIFIKAKTNLGNVQVRDNPASPTATLTLETDAGSITVK